MSQRPFLRALFHCGLVAPLAGCRQSSGPRAVNPGSKRVDLKVWVVLGGTHTETIGRRENAGCRLTAAEMTRFITELQRNANFFSSGCTFTWDGQFDDANTIYFTGLNTTNINQNRRRSTTQFVGEVLITQDMWVQDHINLYFGGAFGEDEQGGLPLAFTRDPCGAQGYWPFIVLCDGGPDAGAGQDPALALFLVFEHEMTHFLGRFTNRPIGPFSYGPGEHVLDTPANHASNILVPTPAMVLMIGDRERSELTDRVNSGQWPNCP